MRKILFGLLFIAMSVSVMYSAPTFGGVYNSVSLRDKGVIITRDGNDYRLVKATLPLYESDVVYVYYDPTINEWLATNGVRTLYANGVCSTPIPTGEWGYVQIKGNAYANVYNNVKDEETPAEAISGAMIFTDGYISRTLWGQVVASNVNLISTGSKVRLAVGGKLSRPTVSLKSFNTNLQSVKLYGYQTNNNTIIIKDVYAAYIFKNTNNMIVLMNNTNTGSLINGSPVVITVASNIGTATVLYFGLTNSFVATELTNGVTNRGYLTFQPAWYPVVIE